MGEKTRAELKAALELAHGQMAENLNRAISAETGMNALHKRLRDAEDERDRAVNRLDNQIRRNNDLHEELKRREKLARDTLAGAVSIFTDDQPAKVIEVMF